MNTKVRIISFVKKEIVLAIAIFVTIITCFFIPIDKEYIILNMIH